MGDERGFSHRLRPRAGDPRTFVRLRRLSRRGNDPAPNGVAGATIALVALFLPGLLLVYGVSPFWYGLRARPTAQAAMRGANAAVVGILGAAFYQPVWTSAVLGEADFGLAAGGFLLLTVWKLPPWGVVALLAGAGAASGLL